MNCYVCGSSRTKLWHQANGYDIHRCNHCGTAFVDRSLVRRSPKSVYNRAYYSGERRKAYFDYEGDLENLEAAATRVLRWIESYVTRGRLIEVGCAMGAFLRAADRRGWITKGFEISEYSANIAEKQHGLDVVCADFTEVDVGAEAGTIDLLVAQDVIEHLWEPEILVRKARSLLRAGGILYVSTGDISSLHARVFGKHWRLIAPPEHVFYFSRKGLNILLRRYDFRSVCIRTFWRRYTLASLIHFLIGTGLPGPVGRIRIPVNAFDGMWLLAKRL